MHSDAQPAAPEAPAKRQPGARIERLPNTPPTRSTSSPSDRTERIAAPLPKPSPRAKRTPGARLEYLSEVCPVRSSSAVSRKSAEIRVRHQQAAVSRKQPSPLQPSLAPPKRAAGARSELLPAPTPTRPAETAATKTRSQQTHLRQQLTKCAAERQALVKENRELLAKLEQTHDFIRDLQTENAQLQQELHMHRVACRKNNQRVSVILIGLEVLMHKCDAVWGGVATALVVNVPW